MLNRKKVRDKGKIKFRNYFQKLKEGDKVSVVRELSKVGSFPKSIQGRAGIIGGMRGKYYLVDIKIGKSKSKRFIIHPVHLKKLK